MEMSYSVSSPKCSRCSLWLLPFVISIASAEMSLTPISPRLNSSEISFYAASHSITVFQVHCILLHQGYLADCDAAEGGDPVLTAKLQMGMKLMNLITPHTPSLVLVFSELLHVKGRKETFLNNLLNAGILAAVLGFLQV